MTDEPLIYTTKGNIPASSLRLQPIWEDTPDYAKVNVQHFLGDELVRNDVYVYDKKGVVAFGTAAQVG